MEQKKTRIQAISGNTVTVECPWCFELTKLTASGTTARYTPVKCNGCSIVDDEVYLSRNTAEKKDPNEGADWLDPSGLSHD